MSPSAAERGGSTSSQGFQDFCLKFGARQGQHMDLNVLFVPNWLDSGECGMSRHGWISSPVGAAGCGCFWSLGLNPGYR